MTEGRDLQGVSVDSICPGNSKRIHIGIQIGKDDNLRHESRQPQECTASQPLTTQYGNPYDSSGRTEG